MATMIAPPAPDAGADAALQAVLGAHVARADAAPYGAALEKGRSLLFVHAPFGSARAATETLDGFGPLEGGSRDRIDSASVVGQGAPFPAFLGFPVLSDAAAPFAHMWAVPVLTQKQQITGAAFGLQEQSAGVAGRSRSFGMPLLLRNPAPLSSLFRLPMVIHHR